MALTAKRFLNDHEDLSSGPQHSYSVSLALWLGMRVEARCLKLRSHL